MEDAWNMAESMLSDVLVSNAYNQFITQNSILFKDKVRLPANVEASLLLLHDLSAHRL